MINQFIQNKNRSGLYVGLGGFFVVLFFVVFSIGCSVVKDEKLQQPAPEQEETMIQEEEGVDYFLPKIDLNNWKVTLPIGNPSEVKPPTILNYATNELLQPFMYNDSIDGGLVFYTYPAQSTANSSYSRTELREQMESGSDKKNWTFAQGGKMRGRLKVEEISKGSDEKFHRTIIMQIHGRLTDEQRAAIGEDDNNAPPMLKIYWANNRIRVKTKVLKDTSATGDDILPVSAWGDDPGVYFDEYVYNDEFTLEIEVEEGRMVITLNDKQTLAYEGVHIDKWGVFENYFKAGNYLATRDEGAFSKVKYYELNVIH
ncbi:MAG: polysaccharide lyase family 7 protein [Bacteroidota bacterium]